MLQLYMEWYNNHPMFVVTIINPIITKPHVSAILAHLYFLAVSLVLSQVALLVILLAILFLTGQVVFANQTNIF